MSKHYEVQHWTICDGWVNCWTTTEDGVERPTMFSSIAEAEAEIDELISEIDAEIAEGLRGHDEGFDREEFRVRELPTGGTT